jgi:16S rRNA processing protein RimM
VSPEPEPEVVVGRIVAPFGRKGEVKVRMETDFPERLQEKEFVWLKGQGRPARSVKVQGVRLHKGNALVKFEGVDDIDAAEQLRGEELRIMEADLKELPEGEFYVHQLLGLRVITESGEELGQVTEVIRSPANDVYVTERAMIPALKDVVKKIDIEAGEMVVRPIPGMLEEE